MARKLNDSRLTILSNSAARDDHRVLPLPKLKAPPVAVTKTINALVAEGLLEKIPAARDDETWEHAEGADRTTLIITPAGLAAIGIADEATSSAKSGDKGAQRRTRARKAGKGSKVAKKTPRARTSDKRESKQDAVIALLQRPRGATIEEMMEATGWQAHSVRGFMSGALKKRLGLEVGSEKDKKSGERRYRIAD